MARKRTNSNSTLPKFSFGSVLRRLVWAAVLTSAVVARADSPAAGIVTFEAESGALGSDWAVSNSSSPASITILTDGAGSNPGSAARVAGYTVTFPSAGTYQLYARLRTGPGTFNDDSLFYATGFGSKSPANNSDWITANGLAGVGFSNRTDVVTGGGTLGSGMWKWVNLSSFAGNVSFTASAGSLTQTFQIGARENGLDLDKFAFGTLGTSFTVSNLDTGTLPVNITLTNTFSGPDGMAIHRFNPLNAGLNLDGANPAAGLVLSGGVLCGATLNGGLQGAGTAFYLGLDGTNFNAFRSFTNAPDAGNPQAGLVFSGSRFFGTSFGGGINGAGTVFVGQTNGTVSLIRNFVAVNADTATNLGGASPKAQVVLAGGTLWGTATAGGLYANGTLFSVTTNGSTFSVFHDFTGFDSNTGTNLDGAVPWGGLVLSGETLFGAASGGGSGGAGVLFHVRTNGDNFTAIYSFTAMDPLTGTNSDGAIPMAGLILSNGTLYGTTAAGGTGNSGTVFSISTDGSGFYVLHQFSAVDALTGTNADGAKPVTALILSSNTLYGTASAGGAGASGTVFSVNTNGSHFKTIYSFTATTSGTGTNNDGAFPVADLLLLGSTLYGTTFGGGPGLAGTVFSLPLPLPPATITNIIRNVNASVTLHFAGSPNSTNFIQTATNLAPAPAWRDVSTNVADGSGLWQFTDTNTGSSSIRFYRSYTR
jgi:uncharacterized repeat protein (TIGR03803 family)